MKRILSKIGEYSHVLSLSVALIFVGMSFAVTAVATNHCAYQKPCNLELGGQTYPGGCGPGDPAYWACGCWAITPGGWQWDHMEICYTGHGG